MSRKSRRIHKFLTAAIIILAIFCRGSRVFASAPGDSMVRFDTTLGSFDVELFNSATPVTVANFLNYLTSGKYVDSLVHRSVPGFVIQGGGWTVSGDQVATVTAITPFPPIVNESGIHNVRGTIAGATPSGNPNGATSQWFINLADNSANLDFQNGGFAVFGQVVGNGMSVVDAIAALPRVNAGDPFSELPIVSFPNGSFAKKDLVIVEDIQVVPEPASAVPVGIAVLCGVVGNMLRLRHGSDVSVRAERDEGHEGEEYR